MVANGHNLPVAVVLLWDLLDEGEFSFDFFVRKKIIYYRVEVLATSWENRA